MAAPNTPKPIHQWQTPKQVDTPTLVFCPLVFEKNMGFGVDAPAVLLLLLELGEALDLQGIQQHNADNSKAPLPIECLCSDNSGHELCRLWLIKPTKTHKDKDEYAYLSLGQLLRDLPTKHDNPNIINHEKVADCFGKRATKKIQAYYADLVKPAVVLGRMQIEKNQALILQHRFGRSLLLNNGDCVHETQVSRINSRYHLQHFLYIEQDKQVLGHAEKSRNHLLYHAFLANLDSVLHVHTKVHVKDVVDGLCQAVKIWRHKTITVNYNGRHYMDLSYYVTGGAHDEAHAFEQRPDIGDKQHNNTPLLSQQAIKSTQQQELLNHAVLHYFVEQYQILCENNVTPRKQRVLSGEKIFYLIRLAQYLQQKTTLAQNTPRQLGDALTIEIALSCLLHAGFDIDALITTDITPALLALHPQDKELYILPNSKSTLAQTDCIQAYKSLYLKKHQVFLPHTTQTQNFAANFIHQKAGFLGVVYPKKAHKPLPLPFYQQEAQEYSHRPHFIHDANLHHAACHIVLSLDKMVQAGVVLIANHADAQQDLHTFVGWLGFYYQEISVFGVSQAVLQLQENVEDNALSFYVVMFHTPCGAAKDFQDTVRRLHDLQVGNIHQIRSYSQFTYFLKSLIERIVGIEKQSKETTTSPESPEDDLVTVVIQEDKPACPADADSQGDTAKDATSTTSTTSATNTTNSTPNTSNHPDNKANATPNAPSSNILGGLDTSNTPADNDNDVVVTPEKPNDALDNDKDTANNVVANNDTADNGNLGHDNTATDRLGDDLDNDLDDELNGVLNDLNNDNPLDASRVDDDFNAIMSNPDGFMEDEGEHADVRV